MAEDVFFVVLCHRIYIYIVDDGSLLHQFDHNKFAHCLVEPTMKPLKYFIITKVNVKNIFPHVTRNCHL